MKEQRCSLTLPKALRGQETISAFPDPIPSEVDGVLQYHDGVDLKEKVLISVSDDVEKSAHGIPFNQTAKNVGCTVRCEECQKPRMAQLNREESKVV